MSRRYFRAVRLSWLAAPLLALGLMVCSSCSSSDDPPTSGEDECTPVLPFETPETDPYSTIIEEFALLAPSGNRLFGMIRRPDPELHGGLCFAAVVLVPGGINPGRLEALGRDAQKLAEAGMVVVTFNAEGRCDETPMDSCSAGEEDYNGPRQQDGLAAIIEYVMDLDYVNPDNIGLKTQSYGITLGAGCAARYPDLPIRYLIDGEGPANSFVTCQEPWAMDADTTNDKHEIVHDILLHYSTYRDSSDTNRAFWSTREADRYIGSYRGMYLRLQAEWDHSQPPTIPAEIQVFRDPNFWWQGKHTTDMVNAAVNGGVPWVRVNLAQHDNAVNATYDFDHLPRFLPGELNDQPWAVRAILEMARGADLGH